VENGQFKGIYVDVLKHVAKKLAPSYSVEVRPVPWKRGLRNLETGQSLALFPPYRNKDRSYIEPYSVPLYRESVVLFCNEQVMKKSSRKFPEDFAGLTIGINLGFALGEKMVAAAKAKTVTILEAKGNEDNLWNLQSGKVDCYANDRLAVHYSAGKLKDNPRFAQFKNYTLKEAIELSGEDAFIGYSAANSARYKADFIKAMNAALEEAKKSGLVEKLVAAAVAR
jgi:polar amino acid transport system substrate-binding protein